MSLELCCFDLEFDLEGHDLGMLIFCTWTLFCDPKNNLRPFLVDFVGNFVLQRVSLHLTLNLTLKVMTLDAEFLADAARGPKDTYM